jgi:hypothetical protein
VDPASPGAPVEPVDPANPGAPVGPVDPANPGAPVGPVDPASPAGPVCPFRPFFPRGPVGPTCGQQHRHGSQQHLDDLHFLFSSEQQHDRCSQLHLDGLHFLFSSEQQYDRCSQLHLDGLRFFFSSSSSTHLDGHIGFTGEIQGFEQPLEDLPFRFGFSKKSGSRFSFDISPSSLFKYCIHYLMYGLLFFWHK